MSFQSGKRYTTGQARAKPYVESGLARGLSANEIGRSLDAAGLGLRRTELLELARDVRGLEASGVTLRNLAGERRPDPSRMPFAKTQQLRAYSFKVAVSGYNSETDQSETHHFSISTDELLTRNEIEGRALAYSVEEADSGLGSGRLGFEPDSAQLVSGTRK